MSLTMVPRENAFIQTTGPKYKHRLGFLQEYRWTLHSRQKWIVFLPSRKRSVLKHNLLRLSAEWIMRRKKGSSKFRGSAAIYIYTAAVQPQRVNFFQSKSLFRRSNKTQVELDSGSGSASSTSRPAFVRVQPTNC